MNLYESIKSNLTEGIHLVAYVRSPYESGIKTIEDTDYNSKKAFADDLRANEYKVLSISDNRDLYVIDHSDFSNLAQLKKELNKYKQYYEDSKKYNPDTTLLKDEIDKLQAIYDEAIKQSL